MEFLIDFILHIDQHLIEIVQDYHAWAYAILFVIIFCETGLVVTPFLPGDSLLFVAGAITALPDMPLHIWWLVLIVFAAAVLGDSCNYAIGHFFGKKLFSHPFHPAFRVTGGRGRVAVDRSEISLSFDQGSAHGKRLGETHKSIVDRGIAVRMVFSHDFADDSRGFDRGMSLRQAELFHAVENPAVDGLQTVAHIGNRTAHIYTQRILKIRRMHNIFDMHRIVVHCHLVQVSSFTHKKSPLLVSCTIHPETE